MSLVGWELGSLKLIEVDFFHFHIDQRFETLEKLWIKQRGIPPVMIE